LPVSSLSQVLFVALIHGIDRGCVALLHR
jgi:hypothetical protein